MYVQKNEMQSILTGIFLHAGFHSNYGCQKRMQSAEIGRKIHITDFKATIVGTLSMRIPMTQNA